ncbi:MAG: HNH endonuclease signature motif containing protein, partial [Ilumatobacteraceae bacterium]
QTLDADSLEAEVKVLMQDGEITRRAGIYQYVLTRDERELSLRTFDDNQKREAYERQDGICPQCGKKFEFSEMDGDHIVPWGRGGKTTADNCQMLCIRDNRSQRR